MINIFILNWKSAEETKGCLNSLDLSDNNNFRIILINNYSTQSDLVEIRDIYEDYRRKVEIFIVENNANLGYAGGNNEGLRFLNVKNLSGDILIVNPDVRICGNTISEMENALTGDVGIVTVRTMNTEGNILFDAKKLIGFFQKNIITNEKKISTDYSQGSCMLIKREMLYESGFFDERFFLYWEEVDFSLRVKKLGRKLIAITTTQIVKSHNSSVRQPDVFYYSVRNARLIKEKHPDIFSDLSYCLYLLGILFLSVKFILKPGLFSRVLSSYFMAIHDSYFNKYYAKGNKPPGNQVVIKAS